MWSLAALVIGFCIDLLVGDPHGFPHPVVLIGKCISVLERVLRCVCPKTPSGERAAGASLSAPRARERDVLADFGRQVPAGREHEGL